MCSPSKEALRPIKLRSADPLIRTFTAGKLLAILSSLLAWHSNLQLDVQCRWTHNNNRCTPHTLPVSALFWKRELRGSSGRSSFPLRMVGRDRRPRGSVRIGSKGLSHFPPLSSVVAIRKVFGELYPPVEASESVPKILRMH